MISYTYKINGVLVLNQDNLTDVVREVEAEITGEDQTVKFSLPCRVKLPAANAENFTAYSNLTHDQIVDWIKDDSSLDAVKAHIALVVNKEKEKLGMQSKPLPWVPASDVPVNP